MAYHEAAYLLVFLPIVLIAYHFTAKKFKWFVLLLAGYAFFFLFSKKLIVFLFATTLLVFVGGRIILKIKEKSKIACETAQPSDIKRLKKKYANYSKCVLVLVIIILVATLGYLKYYNFFAENINALAGMPEGQFVLAPKHLILPIGISFYTLQAIGYMVDVYWEKVGREPLGKVALFLAFFPQIMEGPISLYSQTADQLYAGNPVKWENLKSGALRILWGLFKKMVIADRLNILVSALYDNYSQFNGAFIALAAISYTVQLYMEFSGCMDIIIGSGRMFGINLPENFRQPFFSKGASEFWRRWHITLGVWFKTYIFYPVSMSKACKKWNKFGKKHVGKWLTMFVSSAICLFPVWICNGLWHGAKWSYIFYGIYYFVIILLEVGLEPVRKKVINALHIADTAVWYNVVRVAKTWIIIFVGELFFRADTLTAGFEMFKSMFRGFSFSQFANGALLNLGMDKADFLAVIAGCIVVAIVGVINEKKLLGKVGMARFKMPIRWAIYYALIVAIVIMGAYGDGYNKVDMIYAGF
ncbi:MAG: MBOAT family protein [Lachnospiraceae bacterium]|nr:MBOAT family protein [Lachnospiraceae bacterium]